MAELAPLWLNGTCYTAEDDRRLISALVCGEGVSDPLTSLIVTTTGTTDHSVNVSAGSAFIEGDTQPAQGMYEVTNDAQVTRGLTAPSVTNNRIDTIIARVYDSQYVGATDTWAIEVLEGSPDANAGASGAAFTDTVIGTAAALPANSIRLAYVRVLTTDTASTAIAANNISDARNAYQLCNGAPMVSVVATNKNIPNNAFTDIDTWTPVHASPQFTVTSTGVTVNEAGIYDIIGYYILGDGATTMTFHVVAINNIGTSPGAIIVQQRNVGMTFDSDQLVEIGSILPAGAKLTLNLKQTNGGAIAQVATGLGLRIRKVG